MARPLLPPRGIFTGTTWLYDPNLSAGLKETLLQLMALTWGREDHTTPPLSYAQLEAITHKNARTLRGHFLALRTYHAALRLQPAGTGQFLVALAGWLFRNDVTGPAIPSADGENLPMPDHDHDSDLDHDQNQNQEEDSLEDVFPLDSSDPDLLTAPAVEPKRQRGRSSQPARAPGMLSPQVAQMLQQAGVFPALFAEVAARAREGRYRDQDLQALMAWCADDAQTSDQANLCARLFIARLRAGGRAPHMYNTPPCPQCGGRGRHDPECRRRYLLDDDEA
jgi:hypothetical protein